MALNMLNPPDPRTVPGGSGRSAGFGTGCCAAGPPDPRLIFLLISEISFTHLCRSL